jgi:hypothetical protein
MGIRHLKLLLMAAIGIAGGIGTGGWWIARGETREEGREPAEGPRDEGLEPSAGEGRDGRERPIYELAQFESRRWQRGVVDLPAAVVVAPVAVPVPMLQLPPDVQLAGVLVGSAPELGSAFLRIGSGPVETVRVGQGPKARPELVVTEITREGITVRYQGQ